jgi:hypothetical protein
MKCIDPDVYYFIPQIFNTYSAEYGGSACIKDWCDFVVSKQLGVVAYAPRHPKLDSFVEDALIFDYYRIVDSKHFLVVALQLNIIIDDTTPTILKRFAHRS